MKAYIKYLANDCYTLKKRNIVHYIFLFIQIAVLAIVLVQFQYGKNHLNTYEITAQDMDIQTGTYTEDMESIYIDESYGDILHLAHGPYMAVQKGTYQLTVYYKASQSSSFFFLYDENETYDAIHADTYYFDRSREVLTTEISITRNITALEIRSIYMGEGSLEIEGIVLQQTLTSYLLKLLGGILSVIIIQSIYVISYLYKKEKIKKENVFVFIGLAAIWTLCSYPLFGDYLYDGHDINFHMLRIEGIKDALLSGQFPVRIHPTSLNGAGCATPMFYGELFLYIPACLRMIGVSVQDAFRFYLLLCNAATCAITYYCFAKISKNKIAALIGTLLYTVSPYRLTVLYVRTAVGELSSMIFLPLIIYGVWLIIKEEDKDKKPNWVPLMLGMTGIIQTHGIALEFSTIFLIIIFLLFVKRMMNKARITALIKAAVSTLLLNLWFIVPIINGYLKGGSNLSEVGMGGNLQKAGTFLSQLFMMFPRFSVYSMSEYVSEGVGTELPLSIGTAVLFGCVLLVYLIWKGFRDDKIKFASVMLGMGTLAILFSVHFFPWNQIGNLNAVMSKIVFTMQFPWRFIEFAVLFLCTASAISLAVFMEKEGKKGIIIGGAIAIVAIISGAFYADTVLATGNPYRLYTSNGISTLLEKAEGTLLPPGSDPRLYMDTREAFSNDDLEIKSSERNGVSMTVDVTSHDEAVLIFPFVYYEGYKVKALETNTELPVFESVEHMVGTIVPAQYEGKITACFYGKWYWKVAELISLITVIALLGCRIVFVFRKKAGYGVKTNEQKD